jgi:hypothetical protein
LSGVERKPEVRGRGLKRKPQKGIGRTDVFGRRRGEVRRKSEELMQHIGRKKGIGIRPQRTQRQG